MGRSEAQIIHSEMQKGDVINVIFQNYLKISYYLSHLFAIDETSEIKSFVSWKLNINGVFE